MGVKFKMVPKAGLVTTYKITRKDFYMKKVINLDVDLYLVQKYLELLQMFPELPDDIWNDLQFIISKIDNELFSECKTGAYDLNLSITPHIERNFK